MGEHAPTPWVGGMGSLTVNKNIWCETLIIFTHSSPRPQPGPRDLAERAGPRLAAARGGEGQAVLGDQRKPDQTCPQLPDQEQKGLPQQTRGY